MHYNPYVLQFIKTNDILNKNGINTILDNGKSVEKRRRKATGLPEFNRNSHDSRVTEGTAIIGK